ncbi:unnamed protein product [Blepharisma stoltei]|uniref:Uncharacterized protein n=1 Tax=Blepharisma stoltei TaxID=1481888 RepID=A0AAU9IXR1_9CILI|nr:unnamed protein product [Blepharisma stoltei]
MRAFAVSLFFLSASSYFIPETITEEEKTEVYNQLSQNLIGVKIHYFPEEKRYGMVATKDIKRSDAIAGIPLDFSLTSFDQYPWSSYLSSLGDPTVLIGRLIYEKFVNPTKSWSNIYYHTYPSEVENIYNWTTSEYDYFINIFKEKTLIEFPLNFEKGYQNFIAVLEKIRSLKEDCKDCFKREVWTWAYSIMISQSLEITKKLWKDTKGYPYKSGDENIKGLCILPLADIVKHEPLPNKYKNQIGGQAGIGFQSNPPAGILFADRDIKYKTEVTWNRAPKRNFEMLLGHGIVHDRNNNDFVVAQIARINECPPRSQGYGTTCGFRAIINQFNYDLFNYAFTVIGEAPSQFISSIDEYFNGLENKRDKKAFYAALMKYRDSVARTIDECVISYRTIKRKLEKKEHENERYKKIDKMCLGHHETIFSHKKLTEKAALKSLLFELSL